MERKDYQFKCGLKCSQEELTLEQDIRLAEILERHEDVNADIMKVFRKPGVVEELLSVILVSEDPIDKSKFLKLKNSELKEIVDDFFSLNPSVKALLSGSVSAQVTETPSSMSLSSDKTDAATTAAS